MAPGLRRLGAVARRVLQQLARDRRFLVLSAAAPLAVIYLLRVFLDTISTPFLDTTALAIPIGAFIVHFVTYVLCAIVLVRERAAQTLQRMFVNGYRRPDIIGGYVLAYSVIATMQSSLVLIELRVLFGLTYPGSIMLAIYGVIWLLAVISISLGIFVSNFARTEGQVFPLIPLMIVPSVFLSGIVIDVGSLPRWARWLSRTIPLYYANNVLQRLALPGARLGDEWPGVLMLVAYGGVVLALSTWTLRELD
jgi:ABC-2 type transport system permease protein